MSYIYNEVFGMEKNQIELLAKNLMRDYSISRDTFEDADEEDKDFLKTFSFICLLSFDVYMKKMIIEKIIDTMVPNDSPKKGKKPSKKE